MCYDDDDDDDADEMKQTYITPRIYEGAFLFLVLPVLEMVGKKREIFIRCLVIS